MLSCFHPIHARICDKVCYRKTDIPVTVNFRNLATMRHSQELQTRVYGQDKLPETLEDLEMALEPRLLPCLKPNKTTCFLLRLDFRPVKTRFDLAVRLVSAKRSNLSPVAVTSSRR